MGVFELLRGARGGAAVDARCADRGLVEGGALRMTRFVHLGAAHGELRGGRLRVEEDGDGGGQREEEGDGGEESEDGLGTGEG